MWQGDQKMRADLEQILNSSLPLVLEYDGTYDKVDISDLEEPCRRGIPAAIGELAARFRIGVDGAEKNPSKAFKHVSGSIEISAKCVGIKVHGCNL